MRKLHFLTVCAVRYSPPQTRPPPLPLCWLRRWGQIKTTKVLKRSFSLLFCQNSHQSLQRTFSSPSSSKLLAPLSQIHKMQIPHPAYPCNKLTKLRLFLSTVPRTIHVPNKVEAFFFRPRPDRWE